MIAPTYPRVTRWVWTRSRASYAAALVQPYIGCVTASRLRRQNVVALFALWRGV